MVRIFAAAAVVGVAATSVVAQGDPIAARKALMKENSAHSRIARDMIQGRRPFDLATAKKVFANFENTAAKFASLFPENSKSGDTKALPVIWEKKAEFDAAVAKFGEDAKAASANVKDLDTFKAGMSVVGKHCGGCHNAFRKRS